jgi:hypothetical protein
MCKGGIQMIFMVFFVCLSVSSYAQSAGDYQTKASGNWNQTATWETWNGSGWVESETPSLANGVITIRDGHTVTVTAAVTVDQVVIEAGGQVTHLGGGTLTVSNGPGDDFLILGTYKRTSSTFTMSVNPGAIVRCANGGIYEHALAAAGGSVPTITWEDESIFRLVNAQTASTSLTGLNQSFGIVEINRPGQTTTTEDITFGDVRNELRVISTGSGRSRWNSAFSISGSYVQTGGAITVRTADGSSNFDIGGNFSLEGGTFRVTDANGIANAVTLNVDGNFTMSGGNFIFCATQNTSGPAFASIKGDVTISGGSFAGGFLRAASGFYFNGQSSEQTLTFGLSLSSGGVLDRFYYRSAAGGPTGLNEIYNGTSAQNTVTGTGIAQGVGWTAWPTSGSLIKNLTIDNPAGVTLSTNKTVNETLTLTNGVFTLSNTLTMANGASIVRSGGSLSAAPTFVEQVNVTYAENETAITTGFELPPSNNPSPLKDLTINNAVILNNSTTVDGNLHINAPLNLNDKTITCSNNITTTSTSRIVGNGTLGGGVKLTNNGTIAPGNSIGTITVEGDYEATETANHEFEIEGVANDKLEVTGEVFLAGSLLITDISSEEDPALAESYTFITGSSIDGSFEEDNITLPEGFIINSEETGIFQMVLPVELISFTAREKPQGVWLLWSTASERDSKSFTIEKSSDGRNWFAIGEVEAAGYSDVLRNYQFLDSNPLFGWQYYRLLQKDWDGKSAYYGPVSFFSNAAAGSLEVFPTVFDDQLNLRMQAKGQQAFHFTIRNAMGQALQEGTLAGNGEETTIETRGWPIGGYFVQIYTAQSPLKTLKVFKIQ